MNPMRKESFKTKLSHYKNSPGSLILVLLVMLCDTSISRVLIQCKITCKFSIHVKQTAIVRPECRLRRQGLFALEFFSSPQYSLSSAIHLSYSDCGACCCVCCPPSYRCSRIFTKLVGFIIQSKFATQLRLLLPLRNGVSSAMPNSSRKGSSDLYVRHRAATALLRSPSIPRIRGKLTQILLNKSIISVNGQSGRDGDAVPCVT